MVSSEILPEDIFSLSDESNLQLIVKDALFEEHFVDALVRDTEIISSVGSILKQSKMGSSADALVGLGALRGDLTCWITPDICRDLSLTAMKSFVQTMIKLLKPYKTALDLSSDYSVQYALYVSSLEKCRKRSDNFVAVAAATMFTLPNNFFKLDLLVIAVITCTLYSLAMAEDMSGISITREGLRFLLVLNQASPGDVN